MIEIKKLHIALDDWQLTADLSLAQGQFCALIGPSGAGKSTILNAIAGFLPIGPGQIRINGQDLAPLPPAARPVAMLFQEHNLFAHMSIADNVALGINPSLKLTVAEQGAVAEALDQVGLTDMGNRLPRALSGGQRQRASLARAMLRKKDVLLLDEPFAALGPALRKEMLALVADLSRQNGQTVIMVTHHPEDAKIASDITALVDEGHIAQCGRTDAVFASPCEALKRYLGL
ncbi:thiamine ABC transporter ATP-binding protein [Cohaesibacter sp. CAU 1516]|uniref:thiamine ABC transporter ATP-binding protein n=1 Tax=Cohaesibacter sp. CAU 1516 TaxID=2576038 RepID=UPI0010FDB09A|nr:thiamine ABC transporter ATP-binding protein [Cohaesibacter sp. CAU 1516]TLP48670.1 thiamine ABC transporter ATP-binding protein [Cohaesibacter sp. CAU 1516]